MSIKRGAMSEPSEKPDRLQDFAHAMKRDWDDRAKENAKWFINTVKLQQSDDEFYETGRVEVEKWFIADLALLTQGRDPSSLRLLEIGCGIGRMTKHLAGIFGEVHSTDVSAEMIKQARERLREFPNVRLYETNGLDFAALPDNYFDIGFSVYVFQHVPGVAVIRSNLRDAYRVLKPGGILKFQANGIATPDFDEVEKNTWTGASFPEAEIRRLAEEVGAQLISIIDAGTQYCWTTMRKRRRSPGSALQGKASRLEIESYGRADDPQVKKIPIAGDHSSLSLIVSGAPLEDVDANSLAVEINGRGTLPYYVGPLKPSWQGALAAEFGASLGHLIQVEAAIPGGVASGVASVRVRLDGGEPSTTIEVELQEPRPVAPKVRLITNAHDGGVDIHARGPKSLVRLFVDGLNETADADNVRVQVGERLIKPGSIEFLPANGVYQVKVQLPEETLTGETELRLSFGDLQSSGVPLHIK